MALGYFAFWRNEFLPVFPERPELQMNGFNESALLQPQRFREVRDPLAVLLSLQALAILLTGILLVVTAYYLLKHLNVKEKKEAKKFIIASLLSSEEKAVYDRLVEFRGEATQKQLSASTGFSAVKTYRVIKRLESKKIVKSFPFGMTKKIVLEEA
ncbi:MAG: hypothetical protein V1717_00695 [Candidatus Micrarchaeota archaeon]